MKLLTPIIETCPECGVDFSGKYVTNPSSAMSTKGKTCPAGHWITYTKLVANRRPGQGDERKKPAPRINQHVALKERPINRVEVFRSLGVSSYHDTASLGLAAMLDNYRMAINQLPESSVTRRWLEGAFGRAPEIARRVLEIA